MKISFNKNLIEEKLRSIRVEGITKRWLINIIGVIAVILLIVFVLASLSIKSYYYHTVESIITAGASDSAVGYFSTNLENGNSLEASAADFIDSYSNKDRSTLWIIDDTGKVILSSSGFTVENVKMPDYEKALSNEDGFAKYVGRIENGEKVMAVTRIITDSNGIELGALRFMSTINAVDAQIFSLCFIIAVACLLVMVIIIYSNLFFIRSIIMPVQEINKATKLIAQGNLDARIEKQYNDEIGDLADSINTMAAEIATADQMKNDFISKGSEASVTLLNPSIETGICLQ